MYSSLSQTKFSLIRHFFPFCRLFSIQLFIFSSENKCKTWKLKWSVEPLQIKLNCADDICEKNSLNSPVNNNFIQIVLLINTASFTDVSTKVNNIIKHLFKNPLHNIKWVPLLVTLTLPNNWCTQLFPLKKQLFPYLLQRLARHFLHVRYWAFRVLHELSCK